MNQHHGDDNSTKLLVSSDDSRAALAPLLGLPLWSAGRACNLLWLQFGAKVPAPSKRAPDRIVGEWGVHVQCPWRISGPAGVVTGLHDIYRPADPSVDPSTFEWDRPGRSLGDVLLAAWFAAHAETPLVVREIVVGRAGAFTLRLDGDFWVEVFPDRGPPVDGECEQWRLLNSKAGEDGPHFVYEVHVPGTQPT